MLYHNKKTLLSILLIISMLLSPFGVLGTNVQAEVINENNIQQSKDITSFKITLKASNNSFPAANNVLSNKRILDVSDFDYIITYNSDNQTISEVLTPEFDNSMTIYKDNVGNTYTIDTSDIEYTSAKIGNDQTVSATLMYKDSTGKDVNIPSTDNPSVNIFSSKEIIAPNKISLKLKNKNATTFYVADDDILDGTDTLDEDDLMLLVTFDVRLFNDDYDNLSIPENERYVFKEESETIPVSSNDDYIIKTNIDEVRKTVGDNKELWAELSYKTKDSSGIEKTITIKSKDNKPSNNPTVNIINAGITRNLKAIALELKAESKKKSIYVDNGLIPDEELLNESDLNIKLIYENGKTITKDLQSLQKELTVTTNVDSIKKLVGKKLEISATLSYKDVYGKAVTLHTIDAATAEEEAILSTTAKVTILAPYAINGKVTVTPQLFGADATDISTDKSAIQSALDLASDKHTLVVKFPAGNYYTGGNLYLHSNTTLKLEDGATIIRNSNIDTGVKPGTTDRLGVNRNMFKIAPYGQSNDESTSIMGDYDNGTNIVIEGGTFDGGNISAATGASNLFNLGHASNIKITNATLKNCYGNHLIELSGVKNAEISGCTFTGFRYVKKDILDNNGKLKTNADPKGNLAEAIQIDVSHTGWTSAYRADDTPCKDIYIHDNIFYDYPAAIGNHHSLDEHHHNNIRITNNKISGTTSQNSGIKLFGADDSIVTGNVINNYSTGIKSSASENFVIKNNIVTNADYGIINADGSIGNTTNNNINNVTTNGILVKDEATSISSISSNTINNSQKNGIVISKNADCDKVSNNEINSCSESGIEVLDSADVVSLKANTVIACHKTGIAVYSSAVLSSLTDNTITNCSGDGIYVYSSANVPSISKNTINQAGKNGIEINSGAKAKNIKNNTINRCNNYGVYIDGNSSVTTLSTNMITDTVNNGINVKNDKLKLTFKSNKLIRVGNTAIKVDSKLSSKKKQKYTFSPKVVGLKLASGKMKTQSTNLKKIKLKIDNKVYTKNTKKKKYTFKFKKNKNSVSSVVVTFTDKNKNTVEKVLK